MLEDDLANYVDIIGPYWFKLAEQAEAEQRRNAAVKEEKPSPSSSRAGTTKDSRWNGPQW